MSAPLTASERACCAAEARGVAAGRDRVREELMLHGLCAGRGWPQNRETHLVELERLAVEYDASLTEYCCLTKLARGAS